MVTVGFTRSSPLVNGELRGNANILDYARRNGWLQTSLEPQKEVKVTNESTAIKSKPEKLFHECHAKIESELSLLFPPELNAITAQYARKLRCVVFLPIDRCLIGDRTKRGIADKIESAAAQIFTKELDVNQDFTELEWSIAATHCFSTTAVAHFEAFIEKARLIAEVAIVIMGEFASGGTKEELRNQIFQQHSFSRYVIDKTPDQADQSKEPELYEAFQKEASASAKARTRSLMGIELWLKQNAHLKVDEFVIITPRWYDSKQSIANSFPLNVVQLGENLFAERDGERALQIMHPWPQKV